MENIEKREAVFTKEQLLKSSRFIQRTDILNAVLEDGGKYTFTEAEKLVEKYLKGRVL